MLQRTRMTRMKRQRRVGVDSNISLCLSHEHSSRFADPKADDPKAGADVGKIVNLMAGDANRVSQCWLTIFPHLLTRQ